MWSLDQNPSYHKRFCRTRFRVIYVSGEEFVEVGKSFYQGETQDGAPSKGRGGRGQLSSPLGAAQTLAFSIHWWRGRWGSWYTARKLPRAYQWKGLWQNMSDGVGSLNVFGQCHSLRLLLLGRQAMTNPDKVLKSRDITLPTKIHVVKAIIFLVVMCRCESWAIKAKHRRTDTFKLWCWRRILRVPWTARRSNQSILEEINPEYSFEGLMLKLKLQYFGHLMQRADSFEKTLILGKIEGRRRRG